ncbi:MAG: MFS transporter [Burkholderiales bacterium]|nr:MFS transporter [Burkholderiales bacterium]
MVLPDTYAPFRHRDYRLFIAMVLIGSLSQQALAVAVGWDIYERTGSALALGWVGLAQFIPVLAFFLPAGQLADRHERRRVVAASLMIWVGASLLLVVAAWRTLPVAWMYAAVALVGLSTVLNRAGRDALLAQLVPPETLARAVMWNSTVFQTASVAGPALAGLLIASVHSAVAVYVMNLVGMLVAMGLALAIRARAAHVARRPSTWRDLFGGLTHVWRTKVILGLVSIDLFAVLLGGATALLPVFAKDILHVGPAGLGWLSAGPAIGAVLAALATARGWRSAPPHAGRAFLWAVAVFGAATIVFGLSRWFWLSMVALVVLGAADNIGAVIRQTAVQLFTPDELRGRVSAVNRVFISSSNELGAVESGVLASLTSPVFAVVAGGVATVCIAASATRVFPQLRDLKTVMR